MATLKDLAFVVTMASRAMRADELSYASNLPKSQRDFHAGRRECYLQAIAVYIGVEVKEVRPMVLTARRTKDIENETPYPNVRIVNSSFPDNFLSSPYF